jgi:hypothetical protein
VILSPKAFRSESIELQETAMAYAEFAALSAYRNKFYLGSGGPSSLKVIARDL